MVMNKKGRLRGFIEARAQGMWTEQSVFYCNACVASPPTKPEKNQAEIEGLTTPDCGNSDLALVSMLWRHRTWIVTRFTNCSLWCCTRDSHIRILRKTTKANQVWCGTGLKFRSFSHDHSFFSRLRRACCIFTDNTVRLCITTVSKELEIAKINIY